ncbi:MAG: hypothetical protein QM751_10605 [Paludibacteraceae bacterium]
MRNRKIIEAFEYLYYRIYKQLKKVKTNDTPAFNALMFLVVLQGLNALSVIGLIDHYMKISMRKEMVIVFVITLTVLLFIPNFMYFFRRKEQIYKKYENETDKNRKKRSVFVLLYIIISLAFVFIIGETIK